MKRVSAHLQHSNGSVVLASIKVLTNQLQVRDKEIRAFLLLTKYQKLIPETSQRAIKMQIASSLVTLLGSETEVQYVTLQCVQALLGPYKDELQMHLQVRNNPNNSWFPCFILFFRLSFVDTTIRPALSTPN